MHIPHHPLRRQPGAPITPSNTVRKLAIAVALLLASMQGPALAAQRGPAGPSAAARSTIAPAVAPTARANPTPAPRANPTPVAATPSPKVAFNRENFGATSGVAPGLRNRAYGAFDATQAPGGARRAGLKAGPFRNDAKNGEKPLPTNTPAGKPITYERVNLRPGGHERKNSQGRAVIGSDKSVWVSRHYGQDGGQVKRVQ